MAKNTFKNMKLGLQKNTISGLILSLCQGFICSEVKKKIDLPNNGLGEID